MAGVHRPRLFAGHLPALGWDPIILTVHEKYYEEAPDWNLVKLLPPDLRIEKVNAMPLTKPRLIGDMGLRAFFSLYKKAKQLIKAEVIDFLYIPIPSFYCALLGRWLHHSTGIPYGIDYIDPWVHQFPGSNKIFTRHWLSTKLAKLLEHIAVKHASLITGVAAGYYTPVLERNPHLRQEAVCGAMPYGGESADHELLKDLRVTNWLFAKNDKLQLVYAGAMLPHAYQPLEAIFKSIAANPKLFCNVEFHFIGTGKIAGDANGYNIKTLAEQYGLWHDTVYEYPKRIPYLEVLAHLAIAGGIFVLGSTEPHYTPSKTYQAVLSGKPILAILHQNSTAVDVLQQSRAGLVLAFDGEAGVNAIENNFAAIFTQYLAFVQSFDPAQVNRQVFERYSAKCITAQLALLLDEALKKSSHTQ